MRGGKPASTWGAANRALRVAVPNALVAARVLLGVAFPFVPADWRLWVVLAAAASDFLDGFTARLLRAETDWGKLFDPLADKVFVLVVAGTLLAEGALSPGWAGVVVTRDLVVLVGLAYTTIRREWAVGRRMRPNWLGKLTTTAQFGLLLVLVVCGAAWQWALWLTAGLSLAAAAEYVRVFIRIRRPSPAA
jgi:phosphatidylglycerophosphate synthase